MTNGFYYETLEAFINIKKNCIFCGNPLIPGITNLEVGVQGIPDIYSMLQGNHFNFKLKYDGERSNFDVNISINIKDNRFSFFYYGASSATQDDVARIFVGMKPYIELACNQKSCGVGYYLQSGIIRVSTDNYIKPLPLMWEAFTLNDWWVCNDANQQATVIFSRNNTNAASLKIPHIDFESMSKDKLINRVKTFVTFS